MRGNGFIMCFELLENIYFIIGLFLFLSFSDYWLTLMGQRYYKNYVRKKIKFEIYELNPLWQKSIKKE